MCVELGYEMQYLGSTKGVSMPASAPCENDGKAPRSIKPFSKTMSAMKHRSRGVSRRESSRHSSLPSPPNNPSSVNSGSKMSVGCNVCPFEARIPGSSFGISGATSFTKASRCSGVIQVNHLVKLSPCRIHHCCNAVVLSSVIASLTMSEEGGTSPSDAPPDAPVLSSNDAMIRYKW